MIKKSDLIVIRCWLGLLFCDYLIIENGEKYGTTFDAKSYCSMAN